MVKEGNKVYQMPAVQAVLRTLIGAGQRATSKPPKKRSIS